MSHSEKIQRQKAVLVGLHLPTVTEEEHVASLAELGRLAHTLGFDTLAIISQRRATPVAATVLGEGKLQDLSRFTGGSGLVSSAAPASLRKKKEEETVTDNLLPEGEQADVVIFDEARVDIRMLSEPNLTQQDQIAIEASFIVRRNIAKPTDNQHAWR